jgi:nitroimidazol reductase NimA-like FMN-containing flavoprotein (pyridoxamine 5'-phosphate oxidase superfamily)
MATEQRTPPSARTTVKRRAQRGVYDASVVHAILDEALICHVAHVVDDSPVVLPTIHGRIDESLYLHGSAASRMLRTLAGGAECCATATVIDGLVLARSAFHHSMNYRSVVVFGTAALVDDDEEKVAAMRAMSERLVPGRWDDVRPPAPAELAQTKVLRMPLHEASAKVRTGPPIEDDEDMASPTWAGVLPLHVVAAEPVADPAGPAGARVPAYLTPRSAGAWAAR